MFDSFETIAPLAGSVRPLLAHARFYRKLRYPLVSTTDIKKLVDNLQLNYAHLRILQVSLIIIKHYVKVHYIL